MNEGIIGYLFIMSIPQKLVQKLFPDALIWAAYFALPFYFFHVEKSRFSDASWLHYLPFVSSTLLLMAIYYVNYHLLMPRYFFQKKYIQYSGFIVLILLALVLVPEIDHLFRHAPKKFTTLPHTSRPDFTGIKKIFFFNSFELEAFLSGIFILLLSSFVRLAKRLRESEEEKRRAEFSFLKAQLNPHFLFNTLNSIYSLAYRKSEEAPAAIVKLSGLMRYLISEAQQEKVPLEKVLQSIHDYVELQKLRCLNNVIIDFKIEGSVENKSVAPLLFLPFVENAFKYGVNTDVASTITIHFTIHGEVLELHVSNAIVNLTDIPSERIGIENSRKLLELSYPGQYGLNINTRNNIHYVDLTLQLT